MTAIDRETLAPTRRSLLGGATVLGAGLLLAGSPRRALARQQGAPSRPAAADAPTPTDTKFATLVPINTWDGGGAWAIVSKAGQTLTLCNGGIIAGKDAVVLIDGYNTPDGAQWASALAKDLTGRHPTHVIVTHYHFDHVDGLSGYFAQPQPPSIISTQATRDLMAKRGVKGGANIFFPARPGRFPGLATSAATCVLPDAVIEDAANPLVIDIGGKRLTLRERAGHTASDLNIEVENAGEAGQAVVFTGDMVFHKVFPVYLDALPRVLRKNVAEVAAENGGKNIIVPGHGPLATGADLKGLLDLIDFIAAQAATAKRVGATAKDAAAAFALPETLKDYTPGNPLFVQLAFEAVYRELDGK